MLSFKSILHFFIHQFTFSLGGGIGEAALFGAAFGGAKSLITGEDPLEGALMGGLTGGAMNAATSAILGSGVPEIATTTAEGLPAMVEPGTEAFKNLGTFSGTQAGKELADITVQSQLANQGLTGVVNPNAVSMMQNLPAAAGQGGYDAVANVGQPFRNMIPGSTTVTPQAAEALQNQIAAQANTDITGGVTQGLGATKAGLDWYNKPGFDIRPSLGITKDSTDILGKSLNWAAEHPGMTGAGLGAAYGSLTQKLPTVASLPEYKSKMAEYDPNKFTPYIPTPPNPAYQARYAEGGIASLAAGGRMMQDPVNVDFMQGDMYPMSQQARSFYATPSQMPTSAQQAMASYEPKTNPLTGQATSHMAEGGIAGYSLGGYADGGNPRLLKGPGDGMSDNIPATIGHKQPARLADGEFVVPADVVSHLGNGSTDAGAKHLYAMMDNVRKARTGSKKQGKQIKPEKFLPA